MTFEDGNIIRSMIKQMREDAKLADEMRGVYPGDPDGSIGCEVFLMNKAATWLERIHWEREAELYMDNMEKVTVTYVNDNDPE